MLKSVRVVLAALALATGAMAQNTSYNYDQEADFGKFRSYAGCRLKVGRNWMTSATGSSPQLWMRSWRRKVDQNGVRRRRSLHRLPSSRQAGKAVHVIQQRLGYGPGWRRGWGAGVTTGQTSTINVGSLALDVYDSAAETTGLAGSRNQNAEPKRKPKKREQTSRRRPPDS